jgi:tRNA G18 (ribose-2'-O)-methylase SpoU
MPIDYLDNPADPRLDDFRDIKDRDLRGREGIFLGEQALVVERMLEKPELVRRVLVIENRKNWLESALATCGNPEIECLVVPREIVADVAGFDVHRGVLASGNRSPLDTRTLQEVLPDPHLPATILCCESINNIDNIGMIFRIAAAFGVDAVCLDPACHDPLYRKSLRVSIGHALRIPFFRSTDWEADLERLRRDHGFTLLGASLETNAQPHREFRLEDTAPRVAIVLGSEYEGLLQETAQACDHLLRIPMACGVDSLNVGVAAAVLLDRLSQADRA